MTKQIRPQIRPLSMYALFGMMLATVFCLSSCNFSTTVPIDTIHYDARDVDTRRMLFVFLHGNGDRKTVFDKKGFIEAVRARGLPVDMVSVDTRIGYYMNGTIVTRLKQDVIDPARSRGYEHIWFIGNSLGGFGSLLYAQEHANEITGIVLLGPFLGERPIIGEIRHAGGLLRWEPGDILLKTKEDAEKRVWIWLREHGRRGRFKAGNKDCLKKQVCVPKIYLGYGTYDRFAYAQDLLATLLPPEQVVAIDGGHDWSTWEKLWDRFLDQNIFGP
jgi:pimeloyl-ACP methyl ester carboxylesterase